MTHIAFGHRVLRTGSLGLVLLSLIRFVFFVGHTVLHRADILSAIRGHPSRLGGHVCRRWEPIPVHCPRFPLDGDEVFVLQFLGKPADGAFVVASHRGQRPLTRPNGSLGTVSKTRERQVGEFCSRGQWSLPKVIWNLRKTVTAHEPTHPSRH